ncbi:hypothetical protein [Acidithiobacillus sp.]|uniref:hypothetical protein n=1 Tax=Acidithiobacillus sp. TaxID=1872118 RepID=UPI003D013A59
MMALSCFGSHNLSMDAKGDTEMAEDNLSWSKSEVFGLNWRLPMSTITRSAVVEP